MYIYCGTSLFHADWLLDSQIPADRGLIPFRFRSFSFCGIDFVYYLSWSEGDATDIQRSWIKAILPFYAAGHLTVLSIHSQSPIIYHTYHTVSCSQHKFPRNVVECISIPKFQLCFFNVLPQNCSSGICVYLKKKNYSCQSTTTTLVRTRAAAFSISWS